jgi:hypothetical protein
MIDDITIVEFDSNNKAQVSRGVALITDNTDPVLSFIKSNQPTITFQTQPFLKIESSLAPGTKNLMLENWTEWLSILVDTAKLYVVNGAAISLPSTPGRCVFRIYLNEKVFYIITRHDATHQEVGIPLELKMLRGVWGNPVKALVLQDRLKVSVDAKMVPDDKVTEWNLIFDKPLYDSEIAQLCHFGKLQDAYDLFSKTHNNYVARGLKNSIVAKEIGKYHYFESNDGLVRFVESSNNSVLLGSIRLAISAMFLPDHLKALFLSRYNELAADALAYNQSVDNASIDFYDKLSELTSAWNFLLPSQQNYYQG